MTPTEALTLCRLAKAMCPQQAVDEFTPDAWHLLLDDIRFEDAKEAMVEVCKVQAFVAPAEIRIQVKRIRSKRITEFGPFDVPDGLNSSEYGEFLRAARKRIADGELTSATELETPGRRPRGDLDLRALMPSVEDAS